MENAYRHAFLIEAHSDNLGFRKLIECLDSRYSDIYIHMDKKAGDISEMEIAEICNKSEVYFTKRKKVSWGGYSQIEAELELLESSTSNGPYAYYHLLSGQDMPLRSVKEICDFFNQNSGMEMIEIGPEPPNIQKWVRRIKYYFPLQEAMGKTRSVILRSSREGLIILQKILHIHRRIEVAIYKGANWFSITDSLARYVLSKTDWIEHTFKYGWCPDELFLQTIVCNSYFRNHLSPKGNLRKIDWNRGNPYIFHSCDYDELMNSGCLFARKFSPEVDYEIIKRIAENVRESDTD